MIVSLKSKVQNGRNPYLDLIRGISAFMVVIYHYTTRYDMIFGHVVEYPVVSRYGSYAVLLFFILSGYLAFRGLKKTTHTRFAIRRFFRLFPVYWVALIITWVLVSLYLPERAVPTRDFLINFTMLQGFVGARNVDAAYWTLTCELFFYAIIWFVCFFKQQQHALGIIFISFIVLMTVWMIPSAGFFLLVKKVFTLLYVHCFMIGGILALLEKLIFGEERCSNKYAIIRCSVLLLLLVFFVSRQYVEHECKSGLFLALSCPVVMFAIVAYRLWGGAN